MSFEVAVEIATVVILIISIVARFATVEDRVPAPWQRAGGAAAVGSSIGVPHTLITLFTRITLAVAAEI
jgi:hypothetical protein